MSQHPSNTHSPQQTNQLKYDRQNSVEQQSIKVEYVQTKEQRVKKENKQIRIKQSTQTQGEEQNSSNTDSNRDKKERSSSSSSLQIVGVPTKKQKKKKTQKDKNNKKTYFINKGHKQSKSKKHSYKHNKDNTTLQQERRRRKNSKKRRPLDPPPATPPWIHQKMAYRSNLRPAHPPQRYPQQVLIEKAHIEDSVLDKSMQKILDNLVETINKEPPAQAPRQYRRGSDLTNIRNSHNLRINTAPPISFGNTDHKKQPQNKLTRLTDTIPIFNPWNKPTNLVNQGWKSLQNNLVPPHPSTKKLNNNQVIDLDNSQDHLQPLQSSKIVQPKPQISQNIPKQSQSILSKNPKPIHQNQSDPSPRKLFKAIPKPSQNKTSLYQNPHLVRKTMGADHKEKTKIIIIDLQSYQTQKNQQRRRVRFQQRIRLEKPSKLSQQELSPNENYENQGVSSALQQ